MSEAAAAPQRVLLVQPWTPAPETWLSMTRYAERLAATLTPGTEVSFAQASHVNIPPPLRRFSARHRQFPALPSQWPDPIDLVHFTDIYIGLHLRRFNAVRVLTVHDMMPLKYSRWLARGGAERRGTFLRALRALGRADLIVTPSENTRRELLEARDIDPGRVTTVPIMVPDEIQPPPEGSQRDPATILSIGTIAEYKNLPLLLHALAAPELRGARLVRIGTRFDDKLVRLTAKLGLADRVVELGPISDEQLFGLLHSATVLAQPSTDEGFGMPVAEAMAAGLPVVSSDGGALPEVLGGAGRIVPFRDHTEGPPDLDDARDYAAALAEVIGDAASRSAMAAEGLLQSERFRRPDVRTKLLAAYAAAADFAAARGQRGT